MRSKSIIRSIAIILGSGLLHDLSVEAIAAETRDCPVCPVMVTLQPGSFTMGSADDEEGREPDEGPQRRVTLESPFALGKYEVTLRQFGAFVSSTGREPASGCWYIDPVAKAWKQDPGRNWRKPGFPQNADHPVTCIDWADARAYVDWLAATTGKPYRLPSEAEWEYAARAGTTASRFWGDSDAQACQYANAVDETASALYPDWKAVPCSDGFVYTSPVGRFAPNAWGLHDMPGNLWEWTADCWHADHAGAPVNGSVRDRTDCERRMIRGAAWDDERDDLRSANRLSVRADRRYNTIGIRVARGRAARPQQ